MILPSGPTKDLEICQMAYQILIGQATRRVWIASPYFVPDEATLVALKFAVRRGVDVRVMIPAQRDHLTVWLAAFSFFEEMEEAGVKMMRYEAGFLHQKVILVDDEIAGVGTVNIDERSFRLNFEVTAFCSGRGFVAAVSSMLEEDFRHCSPTSGRTYYAKPFWFRLSVRIARIFSPML
jgi:cardiolipin synthase